MESVLMPIRNHAVQYVQVIRSFFDGDVDIADPTLIRIEGTGRYDMQIGKKMTHYHLSSIAMSEKRIVAIFNPAQEEPCRSCKHRPFCGNYVRMIFPIMHEGEVYGAVSLTAQNPEQSRDLLARKDKFTLFMQTMCDLFILRVQEHREKQKEARRRKVQEELIGAIQDGVMILDEENRVQYVNKRGEKILGCDIHQIRQLAQDGRFSISHVKTENGESEYLVKMRRSRISLSGRAYEAEGAGPSGKNQIIVFADIHTLQDNLHTARGSMPCTLDGIIGDSPAFRAAVAACRDVAFHITPVLFVGEIASGKEVFARALHNEGPFRNNRFIRIAQGYELQGLLDKEAMSEGMANGNDFLFRKDLLDGNTLYIDEVSDLIIENQSIVLAIMQKARELNTRVLCSTSRDLLPMVESGKFHPELYYSLEIYSIPIPPVRDRGADVVLLAKHYLDAANGLSHKTLRLSKDVLGSFMEYPWRGNVREIENTVAYLVEHVEIDEGEVTVKLLPSALRKKLADRKKRDYNLEQAERELIIKALNDVSLRSGSRANVAKELGISNATLYRKLKQYDIKENTQFD